MTARPFKTAAEFEEAVKANMPPNFFEPESSPELRQLAQSQYRRDRMLAWGVLAHCGYRACELDKGHCSFADHVRGLLEWSQMPSDVLPKTDADITFALSRLYGTWPR